MLDRHTETSEPDAPYCRKCDTYAFEESCWCGAVTNVSDEETFRVDPGEY